MDFDADLYTTGSDISVWSGMYALTELEAGTDYSLTEGNYGHFSDRDMVSKFAQQAMRWAVGNGLMVGMNDGTLCPKCNTTRAEFATVIQRFIETIAK